MKQTIRLAPDRKFKAGVAISVFPVLVTVFATSWRTTSHGSPALAAAILVLLFVAICALVLGMLFHRLEVSEDCLTLFDLLNRNRQQLSFASLAAYEKGERGQWVLKSPEGFISLTDLEARDAHVLIAARAPKALKAQRLRSSHLPPQQDFNGISLFDRLTFFRIFPAVGLALLVSMFIRSPVIFILVAVSACDLIEYGDLFGSLSLKSDGIEAKWPWHGRNIPWGQVTAVFCERGLGGRYFIITGADTWIRIPAHAAADPETLRKIFRSLPQGTRIVNYESTRPRKRRKRKSWKLGKPTPAPEPAMGF